MATTPKFLGLDGQYREEFNFSSTIESRFFQGQISTDTIDVQVSIRGSDFESDPNFVFFEGDFFIIPNPAVFPNGLDLLPGNNSIRARAVDLAGSVSGNAETVVNLVQEGDLGLVVEPPTNISLVKNDATVTISIQGTDSANVVGYNFYGSVQSGGGTQGYFLLNRDVIISGTTQESTSSLGTLEVDAAVPLDNEGNPVADPLFFHVVGTQEDINETILQMDFNEVLEVPENVRNLRTTIQVNSVSQIQFFSFTHDRAGTLDSDPPTIPNGEFTSVSATDPVYYVVTAIYQDPVSLVEIESSFSEEVVGFPLTVRDTVGGFAQVSEDAIRADSMLSIYSKRPEVSTIPGSVTRDVFIDPFAREAQRVRFLVDFLHRATSFSTLLRIDDPSNSGESVPVSQSEYKLALKQAFNLNNDVDVQDIIDGAFEKLASNFGEQRLSGDKARGEVVFFTRQRPTASISIPIGTIVSGGGVRFRTTAASEIPIDNIASFFNPTTGRYSVRISIQAEEPGSSGNLGPGQIRVVDESGPSNVSVINDSSTFGGTDIETNRDLAVRAQNKIASVDVGTFQGYRRVAIAVPGVREVGIIDAGDPLMQRDYDTEDKEHKGGKVDAWIRGSRVNTVTDSFAFSFEISQGQLFEVVGDPNNYEFKSLDSSLSETNPIIEMLSFPEYNYGFRNDSTGEDFDLTDVEITSFNTIKLSTTVPQPAVSLLDVLRGDYRYRLGNKYILPRQPVNQLVSFTGTSSGTISPNAYVLVRAESPLQKGRSASAGDYLQVIDSGDPTLQIPSSTPLTVSDETHVILADYIEYLDNLGINPLTVDVYNEDRSTLYRGPFDPSGSNDFTIIEGENNSLGIQRTETGNILSGETLSIDYSYDENFTVEYTVDFLIGLVQQSLDTNRHLTADVLAKQAVPVPVDIDATIVLQRNQSPETVDPVVRTNVINYIEAKGRGVPLRQSEIVQVINATVGVSYVVTPLTKMVRAEDSLVIRETLTTSQESDLFLVSEWSTETVSVYLILDSLNNATTDGGGPEEEFRGVFKNDDQITLQTVSPEAIGQNGDRAFIIGNDGLVIPGYSDDTTLGAGGCRTNQEISSTRQQITQNRVLVSIVNSDSLTNYSYTTTYIVAVDSGVKNIEPGSAEYVEAGDFDFTYDEDRNF